MSSLGGKSQQGVGTSGGGGNSGSSSSNNNNNNNNNKDNNTGEDIYQIRAPQDARQRKMTANLADFLGLGL